MGQVSGQGSETFPSVRWVGSGMVWGWINISAEVCRWKKCKTKYLSNKFAINIVCELELFSSVRINEVFQHLTKLFFDSLFVQMRLEIQVKTKQENWNVMKMFTTARRTVRRRKTHSSKIKRFHSNDSLQSWNTSVPRRFRTVQLQFGNFQNRPDSPQQLP